LNGETSEMAEQRKHKPEFRVEIVERMLAGEDVSALSKQRGLARSMMYRWRDTYRSQGAGGLARAAGGSAPPKAPAAGEAPRRDRAEPVEAEQKLRQRIAELERIIGRQAVEIDFFKGVFKRLKESPKAQRRGDEASTRRSGK
jgi:transposase